ncbi:MAG: isoaspartyl peptidase/L-asparaginase [Fimbriimonas sp.]
MSTTFLATWREPGQIAVETAWAAHEKGADLRTALEKGLAVCEEDPRYIAIGLGSLPNADGVLELDASMMDGADLSAGAVCSVRDIVPVISVARKVLEETPHVMLAGDQARRFAIEKGIKPRNLHTAESCRLYEEWRAGQIEYQYLHTTDDHLHGDTVTMLGWTDGHMVSASATSGLAWKLPGRVGDSPIVGAGIYADDEAGAAGATGLGEELWKACASFRTVEGIRRGMTAQEACDDTIRQMVRRQPGSLEHPCVVLAISKDGDFGAATTQGEFQLWICQDGAVSMQEVRALS